MSPRRGGAWKVGNFADNTGLGTRRGFFRPDGRICVPFLRPRTVPWVVPTAKNMSPRRGGTWKVGKFADNAGLGTRRRFFSAYGRICVTPFAALSALPPPMARRVGGSAAGFMRHSVRCALCVTASHDTRGVGRSAAGFMRHSVRFALCVTASHQRGMDDLPRVPNTPAFGRPSWKRGVRGPNLRQVYPQNLKASASARLPEIRSSSRFASGSSLVFIKVYASVSNAARTTFNRAATRVRSRSYRPGARIVRRGSCPYTSNRGGGMLRCGLPTPRYHV